MVDPAVVVVGAGGFVITWAALFALGGIVGLAAIIHVMVLVGAGDKSSGSLAGDGQAEGQTRTQPPTASTHQAARRRRGLKSLVIGSDGRASTSKVHVVL